MREHVGKGQEYLVRRIRESAWGTRLAGGGYSRAGTFSSLGAANKLINSVLAEHRSLVEQVISGASRKQIRLNKWFASPTGFEAFTDRPWDPSAPIAIRDTYGAAVVIVKNPNTERGFSIVTAFPFFDIKE
ncbi:MAG: RNase A-like domain-containing protein [Methylocystis sp.]|uniref:RNase A-like domain-containing protein n=1 Tax=Methylocystis sp. TaxID=1911079 RepID=UPI003DA2E8B5